MRALFALTVLAALVAGVAGLDAGRPGRGLDPADAATSSQSRTPIQHVVVIFQENHSFDNVLGGICVSDRLACAGTTTGVLHTGARIPLRIASDVVPQVAHMTGSQTTAINGGKMNGFDRVAGCGAPSYQCYTQYRAGQIANLRRLAESYVMSDRTFSEDPVPSWGGHLQLIAGQLDGFLGDNPLSSVSGTPGLGWGCDSNLDTPWRDPANASAPWVMVPSCIPRADGFGPYRTSPVQYVPTILDRLSGAGLAWKLYADTAPASSGYRWSVCPSFASCMFDQANNNAPDPRWVDRSAFAADAAAGTLPAYSVVLPSYGTSQHNGASMRQGDNYIASLVNDVMSGPADQWKSTVIFITYDDCGCFYDHVAPPAGSGLGIRVPMVIVSPQAKAAYVDHGLASYDSMLAFVEQNWNLAPPTPRDANAYDYCRSFVFSTLPCTGPAPPRARTRTRAAPSKVTLQTLPVPAASAQWAKTHPLSPTDPT